MRRTIYSRHLSIAGKPNNRPYKTFPATNLYTFYFRQVFIVSCRFFFIFVVLFFRQFNGLFRSIKMKTRVDFQTVLISMVDVFLTCKDAQSEMEQGYKLEYNHGDFCCISPTTCSLQWHTLGSIGLYPKTPEQVFEAK